MKSFKFLIVCLIAVLGFSSCDEDDSHYYEIKGSIGNMNEGSETTKKYNDYLKTIGMPADGMMSIDSKSVEDADEKAKKIFDKIVSKIDTKKLEEINGDVFSLHYYFKVTRLGRVGEYEIKPIGSWDWQK
ncbi:MAG: hypothetical protein ACRCZQ_05985 [Bacteroidales bacterium]